MFVLFAASTTPRASVEVDQRLITPLPRLATSDGERPFGAACTACLAGVRDDGHASVEWFVEKSEIFTTT